MDAQQFLAEFGHIANAPGGVTRLRELVLQLAISGRLTARIHGDTPAVIFLQAIRQEQAKLIGRTVSIKPIAVAEQPYPLPKYWQWVRCGEYFLELCTGPFGSMIHEEDYVRDGVPLINPSHMVSGKIVHDNRAAVKIEDAQRLSSYSLSPGDIVLARRGEVGRYAIVEDNQRGWLCGTGSFFAKLHVECNRKYLGIVFRETGFRQRLRGNAVGITMTNLNQRALLNALIPIPPLEEQSRIVAKVDELMALCDHLEVQQQARRKLQNALRQSTLQALASAQSPHELQESWRRLQANFGRLFSTPEDVDDVLAELKNLAVRGLLANASAAAPDLDRVKADCAQLRAQYIDAGIMRRQKLVGMAEDETSYPDHWAVTALDEVAVVIGGVTKGRDLRGKQVVVCPYLAVANVQRGYFKLDALKSIEIAADELAKYRVQEGDLLITEGGDWDKVGRTAIWRGQVENCLHQNHVFKARVPSEHLLKQWVELVFNSGVGRDYFAGASKQTTNLASINMTQLRSFPLPIPPLDEQLRILSALAELTEHCTAWRHQLERKQALSAQLAATTVAALTLAQKEDAPVKTLQPT